MAYLQAYCTNLLVLWFNWLSLFYTMIIGSDFQPIQFDFFGFSLLEPNTFIGDILLFGITFAFYLKIQKTSTFNIFWSKFFFYTGVSFLLGGFGHLLFNYRIVWKIVFMVFWNNCYFFCWTGHDINLAKPEAT